MALISKLKDKKILILGVGVEGVDNFLFIKKNVSYKVLGVADVIPFDKLPTERKNAVKGADNFHFGENYLSAISQYDVIIKSPGIPLSLMEMKEDQILTSQSDIFLNNCKGKIIGVTGTKGKSTTCSLIYKLLKTAGYSTYLVGNIGRPALSFLGKEKSEDIFVYELSSFQLATVHKSPQIAIFLNLYIDHLDKHESFEDYVSSKEKITAYQRQNDFLIYNNEDKIVKKIAEKSQAKKIPFVPEKKKDNIATPLDPIFKVAKLFDINENLVTKITDNFDNLPHRLQFIGKFKRIHFYNDSASTIPEATIYAIGHIKNAQTLILGGIDKGADCSELFQKIRDNNNIENIILFKGSGKKVEDGLQKTGKKVFHVSDMKEAVEYSFKYTEKGKVCLLSPAFASFNLFKNYKERGKLFIKYVNKWQ